MKNKRRISVIACLIVCTIYLYITLRGEYLQIVGVGQEYIPIFMQNLKYKIIITVANFLFVFIVTYITTIFIKKGLKKFFIEEKTDIPKLPNKSIALFFGTIISIATSNIITKNVMLAFNNTWFGINDPVFKLDIGIYIFQKPFIEMILYYFIAISLLMAIYITIYYLICFNKFFKDGIDGNSLKKSIFVKQIIVCSLIIVSLYAIIKTVAAQNILFDEFINTKNGTPLIRSRHCRCNIKSMGR